ncbi:MAG TPA: hypothetical protein VKI00_24795 [Mycobacterium sp.]|uniref:hypothetical protein n=1 Tax=Mycobacterium sp. TaxID=1785 RepID=UPI002D0BB3F1|nr:hypothetical protein [Mycobacterium sp.]HME78752.1 hypothetical protein [Mycobacterium sp.]
MPSENDDLQAERDRLSNECMRLRVERSTGVPADLLRQATTKEEANAVAAQAITWRGDVPPAPAVTAPTGAATYGSINGVSQVSRNMLQYLSADQINQLRREGRFGGRRCGH